MKQSSRKRIRPPTLAWYVSAHGYGHGSRTLDILSALLRLRPDASVTLVTKLPVWFLRLRLKPGTVAVRRAAFDVGLVQPDVIRADVEATRERLASLYQRRSALQAAEMRWLQKAGVDAVVADIPAIPLEAAHRADIPTIAVGNFAWDWIYEPFARRDVRWKPLISALREGYACADLLLRLPFHEPMRVFRRIEDVPLTVSAGRRRRREIAVLTGADPKRHWVLLSFFSLDLKPTAIRRLSRMTDYEFFTVMPLRWQGLNFHAIDPQHLPFADLLASADSVVSKPGYGIVSDCAINRKPLACVERFDFREADVLARGVRRHLRHVFVPANDLYRGDLSPYLERLRAAPEPRERLPAGGALRAARRILALAR